MFQDMRRQLLGNQKGGAGKRGAAKSSEPVDPNAFVAEMQKHSPYQQRVADNIIKYGPIIKDLAKEVANFAATDIKHLLEFVESTDAVLEELEDEHAVLKQGNFEWPKKYQTFREAKVMYEKLQGMKKKFKEWPRNKSKTVAMELADIQKYMEQTIDAMDKLERTREGDEKKYKEANIPWDKKIMNEVKVSSLFLMDTYMKIALEDVEKLLANETNTAKLKEKGMKTLNGTVRFAFKVHQFAGGFDEACNTRFFEISERVKEFQAM